MNKLHKEEALTLEILEAIDEQDTVTQRIIAHRTGVALGLANSYLKRCVRKGLVKISQAPANRYLYYLTPMGFAEKSRLTAQYLSNSFEFYRRAGESCARVCAQAERRGWRDIVLCGASDLAEIALLRAQEQGLRIAGVHDADPEREQLLDHTVQRDLAALGESDAWLLTDLRDPQATYLRLAGEISPERILVPSILGVKAARDAGQGTEQPDGSGVAGAARGSAGR
jgi:DNA-binding MarR family transcriptional regulator